MYIEPVKMSAKEFALDYDKEGFKIWYTRLINECRIENQKEYERLVRLWNNALTAVAAIWGTDSRQYKYVRREYIPDTPDLDKIEKSVFRSYDNWLKKSGKQKPVPQKIMPSHEPIEVSPISRIYDDPNTRNY